MRVLLLLALSVLAGVVQAGDAWAGADEAYARAMSEAREGRLAAAIARLEGAAEVEADPVWRARMRDAAAMLGMLREQRTSPPDRLSGMTRALVAGRMKADPAPNKRAAWPAGLLGAVLPGAGHAWLGRWRDAGVAAGLVLPMLLLTLWAARRRMGPVTVFFGLITVWLWSGTVFSAVSLAERGSFEQYLLWWQGLWQASGLPGRPW